MSPVPALSLATDEDALHRMTVERASQACGSASPDTPPYSPITPILSPGSPPMVNDVQYHHRTSPARHERTEPPLCFDEHSHHPTSPPLPFSEGDNSDATALRAALSILLIQRQNVLRDMKTLERQKHAAVADPKAFIADVIARRVKTARSAAGFGNLSPRSDPVQAATEAERKAGDENAMDLDDEEPNSFDPRRSIFDEIPGRQNIIRTPPINWAKYHIVGEALDRLHEEQRARPSPGEPGSDGDGMSQPGPRHVIAAPYDPWTDKLSEVDRSI